MQMRQYGLNGSQWERIKGLLPGRAGHVGRTSADNPLFVEPVLYRYRAGNPWAPFHPGSGTGRMFTDGCTTGAKVA
ncbi:hypothetical protein AOE01nite_14810 [Acetobacter oeni]|uniref:Transposase n=1 Tax=Acetobacter oeni TaxID=304077 RepID=A0A511XJW9_9PROT|nr:transposase [Acetobacter oeni]NHO19443.1 transposase [Acetobacter oeni]GEN63257.1 hypothetical protein AOE01nite_14810 [Acetobacter oeni]